MFEEISSQIIEAGQKLVLCIRALLSRRAAGAWPITIATVIGCEEKQMKPPFYVGVELFAVPIPPTYRCRFEYQADHVIYVGAISSGGPQEVGTTFEIAYDPSFPCRNTLAFAYRQGG